MSDEPKKRSRVWIGWAVGLLLLLLLLLLAYPLSMGPVLVFAYRHQFGSWMETLYTPLIWTAKKSSAFRAAMNSHLRLSSVSIADPE